MYIDCVYYVTQTRSLTSHGCSHLLNHLLRNMHSHLYTQSPHYESPHYMPKYAAGMVYICIHYLSTYMMFVRVNPGLITPYAVELGGYHFSSHKNHWGNHREFTKVKQCHVYHPLGMVSMPPLKVVMTGEWFMIVLPTTLPIEDAFCSRHLPFAACVLLGLESQV